MKGIVLVVIALAGMAFAADGQTTKGCVIVKAGKPCYSIVDGYGDYQRPQGHWGCTGMRISPRMLHKLQDNGVRVIVVSETTIAASAAEEIKDARQECKATLGS